MTPQSANSLIVEYLLPFHVVNVMNVKNNWGCDIINFA